MIVMEDFMELQENELKNMKKLNHGVIWEVHKNLSFKL